MAWPRVRDPHAYVRRALIHAAGNRWRRRHRRPERPLDGQDPSIPDHASDVAERERVLRALSRLSYRQRAVIVLRYYDDRSEAEIAALLGCSAGTVKTHASRGLDALRDLLATREDLTPARAGRRDDG